MVTESPRRRCGAPTGARHGSAARWWNRVALAAEILASVARPTFRAHFSRGSFAIPTASPTRSSELAALKTCADAGTSALDPLGRVAQPALPPAGAPSLACSRAARAGNGATGRRSGRAAASLARGPYNRRREDRRDRRRPGRPVLRDPDEAGRSPARGHRRRAQPPRRHLRLRRGVLRRHARQLPRGRPRDATPAITRAFAHWDDIDIHYQGQVSDLDRPRLLRPVAPAAARHPPGAGDGARRRRSRFSDRGRSTSRPGRGGRPRGRRRRREQRGARSATPRTSSRTSTGARTGSCGSAPRSRSPRSRSLQGGRARALARARLPVRRRPLDVHRRDDGGDLAARRPGRRRARTTPSRSARSCSRASWTGTGSSRTARCGAASPPSATRAGTTTTCVLRRRRRPHRALLDRLRHQAGDGGRDRARARRSARTATSRPALAAYEAERRPTVEALQRAAQASLEWFEQTERYHGRARARPVRLQPADAQPAA